MTKFALTIVLLLLMFLLIPPLFTKNMIFDSVDQYTDSCGNKVIEHGLYFDNVFFTIQDLTLAYLGITIPFVFQKLGLIWKRLSIIVGGWYFSGLVFELINFKFPSIVLNYSETNVIFTRAIICVTIGVVFIITSETWSKQKR